MTCTETFNIGPIPKTKIVGPYSKWPRKPARKIRTLTKAAIAVAGLGVIAHCLPAYLV